MIKKVVVVIIILCVAGCALFGIFSLSKNNRKELIEVRRIREARMVEEIVLDDVTMQHINTTWDQANPLWKNDLSTYLQSYVHLVAPEQSRSLSVKQLFINIIIRTIRTKGFSLPIYLTIDDFGAVLAFPEGVDPTVYWFIYNAPFPMLGFELEDFLNIIVP